MRNLCRTSPRDAQNRCRTPPRGSRWEGSNWQIAARTTIGRTVLPLFGPSQSASGPAIALRLRGANKMTAGDALALWIGRTHALAATGAFSL